MGSALKVKEVLEKRDTRIVAVTPERKVQEVIELLERECVGAVMIRDWDGCIIGIFSERDVVNGLATKGEKLLSLEVGAVMTSKVVKCSLDDELDEILEIMTRSSFRHMPVICNQKIAGIISLRDLVSHKILGKV